MTVTTTSDTPAATWALWDEERPRTDFVIADFNGDGRDDVVARDASNGEWQAAISTGSSFRSTIWGTWSPAVSWSDFTAGDFNGDGRQDLAARDESTGDWQVAVSTGTAFVSEPWGNWDAQIIWTDILPGDFNGDGFIDIVGRDSADDSWHVAVSDGIGYTNQSWGAAAQAWSNAAVVDVNRDGRDDLVGQNTGDDWHVGLSSGSTFTDQLWETVGGEPYFTTSGSGEVEYHARLDAALDAFEFVRNNVAFQPYAGSMKGAQATQETLAGNAWDQSALLVDMLAVADIDARYVVGEVTVSDDALDDLQDWLGVTSIGAAANVLVNAGLRDPSPMPHDGQSFEITFDHAWVEAYLPGPSGLAWQALDPSWKFRDFQPGVAGLLETVPFDEDAFFSPVSRSYSQDFNENDVTGATRTDTTYLGERFDEEIGDFKIVSQALVGAAPGESIVLLEDAIARTSTVEATISVPAGTGMGLIARHSENADDTTQYYLAQVVNQSGTVTVRVYKVLGAPWTLLSSVVTLPSSTGTLRFEVAYDSLRVLFNGVEQISIQDADPITYAGRVGARAHSTASLDDLQIDWTEPRAERPVEFYEDQLEAWLRENRPGISLADVAYDGPIIAAAFDTVPAPPEYAIESQTTYTSLPETDTHRVRVTLKEGSTELLNELLVVPEVSLDRITIAYVPSGGELQAQLLVNGEPVATSGTNTVASGAAVTLLLDHYNAGTLSGGTADNHLEFQREAGQYHAIALNARQHSSESLRRLREVVNDANLQLALDGTFPADPGEELFGSTLALALVNYYAQLDDQAANLTGLTGAIQLHGRVGSGIATSDSTVEYRNDLQVFALPQEFGVDLPNNLFGSIAVSGESVATNDARFRIVGYHGSALEHAVLEEMVSVESVSTVRGLQWATDNAVRIYELEKVGADYVDHANGDEVIPDIAAALQLSDSSVETEIVNRVNAGEVVTVPQFNVHMDEWNGSVYTAERRQNGVLTGLLYAIDEDGGPSAGGYNAGGQARPAPNHRTFEIPTRTTVGDPVNVGNGNMYRDETDIALPNIGLPLVFSRHYDALSTDDWGLGTGWSFSFGDRLEFEGPVGNENAETVWRTSTGIRHAFYEDLAGAFDVPASFLGGSFTYDGVADEYTATDKHGMSYVFRGDGRLIEIRERNQSALGIARDGSGRITTVSDVTDELNPVTRLTFAYPDADTQTITDFGGRTWTYTFVTLSDAKRYLAHVASPPDAVTAQVTVAYDYVDNGGPLQGFMSRITEPNGGTHDYSYYVNGKSFEVTDAEGFRTHATYNLYENISTFADERGHETEFHSDNHGLLVRQVDPDRTRTVREWDVDRQLLTSATDAFGLAETYQYDADGNLAQLVQRDGVVTTFEYEPNFAQVTEITRDPDAVAASGDERVTQFQHDANGNVTQTVDALGNTTTMTYTARGLLETRTAPKGNEVAPDSDYTTTFEYNALGLVTRQTGGDPDGAGGLSAPVSVLEYDSLGRLTSSSDPTGITTTFDYDLLGRRLSQTLPDPDGAGPLGELTTQFAYGVMGDLLSVTDAAGRTVHHFYDLKRNRVETEHADGTFTRVEYDGHANATATFDALGRETQFVFDSRNRPVQALFADGAVSRTHFDGAGRVVATIDPNGNRTAFTFDEMGRPLTTVDALGHATTSEYDAAGNLIVATDRRGEETHYEYDLLDRVIEVRRPILDPGTGQTTGFYSIATTDYDANGNVVRQVRYDVTGLAPAAVPDDPRTLPSGLHRVSETVYDGLDRPVEWTDAAGESAFATYDAAGRMLTQTDRLGRVTSYGLDGIGRRISETLPDPDGAGGPLDSPVTTSRFDAAGNLVEIVDPLLRSTTFEYDVLNRRVRTVDSLDGVSASVYDAAGQMSSSVDELGRSTRLEYDARGRLTREILPDPDLGDAELAPVSRREYDAAGNLVRTVDALGRASTVEYDALNRPVFATPPVVEDVSFVDIVDNADAGFSTTGSWTGQNVGYGHAGTGTTLRSVPGQGDTASWTVTGLEAGFYRVWATWFADDDRAVDAPFTVLDGSTELATITLDQTTAPDDLQDAGWGWEALGGAHFIGSGTLTVRLSDLATGDLVVADAVRIERIEAGSLTRYDEGGNPIAATDQLGRTSTFMYDGVGRAVTQTLVDPDGPAGPLVAPSTTSEFDALGQLVRQTDQLGRETVFEYDLLGRRTLERLPDPDGPSGPALPPETAWAFDAVGNLLSVTDALSRTTTWTYDNLNRRLTETLPDPDLAGPLPAPFTTSAYDAVGNLTSVTDHLGRVTAYEYDDLNRRTLEVLPDPDGPAGPALPPETAWAFDAVGNLLSVTDALGRVSTFEYDRLDRQVREVLPDPDGPGGPLDAPETAFRYDAVGNQVEIVDALGQSTTFEFDARNRLVRETRPDPDAAGAGLAPQTTYEYDLLGNLLIETVRLDATTDLVTAYSYDPLNRQLSVTDPNGDTTTRAYDDAGRLASLTDAELNTTTFLYDDLDRLIEEINELSASRLFEYDAVGNRIAATDRNGRVREFDYDRLDRLIEERWLDAAQAVVRTVAWSFDSAGRLASVSDENGAATLVSAYAFSYDDLDRLLVVDNTAATGGLVVVLTAEYDVVGNRTSLDATVDGVSDFANAYTFDALDRMTRIEQTDGAPASGLAVTDKRVDLAYNALGQFTGIDRHEDLAGTELVATSTWGYDLAHRLTSLDHEQGTTSLAAYTWQFDAADRITGYTSPDGTAAFSYDALGQLTAADFSFQTDESYTYDGTGNRTNTGYVIDANNRLASDGTYDYLYDDEGNRTRKTEIATGEYVEYVWDHRQRLTRLEFRDSLGTLTKTVEYTYDGFDQRIGKRVLDGTGALIEGRAFVYDGDDVVLVFDDAGGGPAGSLTNRYLHCPAVDQVFADEDALAEVLWGLADHQGTVRDVAGYDAALDETTVANHLEFDSFGNLTAESAPAVEFAYAYTGREWDADAELYYYRARWYDPLAGRFLSEDPSGFDAGDANLYRYVTNSPLNFTDPTGRRLFSPVAAAVRAAGALTGLPFGGAASLAIQSGAGRGLSGAFSAARDFGSSVWDVGSSLLQGVQTGIAAAGDWLRSGYEAITAPRPLQFGPYVASPNLGAYHSVTAAPGRVSHHVAPSNSTPGSDSLFWGAVKAPNKTLFSMTLNAVNAYINVKEGVETGVGALRDHTQRELREAGNDVRDVTGVVARTGELIYSGGPNPDNPYLAAQGAFVGQVIRTGGDIVASVVESPIVMLPGGAEALDFQVLVDPNAAAWQKGLAGFSLGASVLSFGMTPNFGAFARTADVAQSNVRWIDDTPNMSQAARNYEDAATGARSNVATRSRQVPVIDRTLPDGTRAPVKFDGFDGNVLIDRKRAVTTFQKSKDQALRQSQALRENNLTGRWEVPDEAEAVRARKMLRELDIRNIDVEVAP